MSMSRRQLLASMLASGLLPATATSALSDAEPFAVTDETRKLAFKWQRRDMEFETQEPAGTIVIDATHRFLYHVLGNGMATRYGVAVGKGSKSWKGEATVKKMVKWPVWTPTPDHLERYPSLAKWIHGMPGGPENPMGARALYLYQGDVDTTYRIHGGTKPGDIGRQATAGCFGLLNVDAIHLYNRVQLGARVVVLKSWI